MITEQPITDTALAAAKQLAPFSTYESDVQRLITEAGAITVTDINDKDGMKAAETARKRLKKLRCDIENRRKELVEDMTQQTRAINSAAAKMKGIIETMEEKMLALEEFAERAEAARLAALKSERQDTLRPYSSVPVESLNLETLADAEWLALLGDFKAAHADRLAREAAEKAEKEANARAEAAALAIARAEADRLRAEAAERDKALAAERAETQRKLDAERVLAEIREREERQKREAAEKALADERARIAAESAAVEEANRKAAMAPDKEKLVAFANALAKLPLPELSVSTAGLIPVKAQMRKFIAWIVNEASKL